MNSEAKVGLFFVIAIVIICFLIIKTGQFEIFGGKKAYQISAILDTAAGLDNHTDVRMAGVKIGTVKDIRLKDGKALVIMDIFSDVQLPEGSIVKVTSKGILGDKYIEIVPGHGAGKIAANSTLPTEKSVTVDDIMTIVYNVASDLKKITQSLSNTIGTKKGEREIGDILDNIHKITEDLKEITSRNKDNLTDSISNVKAFTGDLREQVPKITRKLDALLTRLDKVIAENRSDLRETIKNAKESTKKLSKTLDYVESISRKIDEGKGTIGMLVNDEKIGKHFDETLISFKNAMDAATDYLNTFKNTGVYLGFKSEYMFDIDDSKSYFTIDIVPNNHRYYQVQIIDSPYGKVKENSFEHIITNDDGSIRDHYTETIISNRDALKFSATIGQQFGDFLIKVGMIESKGGFGISYLPKGFDGKLSFTVDAWDFSRENDLDPHVKVFARYRFYRDFFLTAGADDILESDYSQYFLGIGIRFRDDYFKTLLSNVSIR